MGNGHGDQVEAGEPTGDEQLRTVGPARIFEVALDPNHILSDGGRNLCAALTARPEHGA